jgi:hypothetical protein
MKSETLTPWAALVVASLGLAFLACGQRDAETTLTAPRWRTSR